MHLRPHAPVAERVLLPGDPGRALRLAQALIEGPRMLNHNRGLWGYSGPALGDGEPLTIQSTGMGGPSAAIVVAELIGLGARRLVRVGTCAALDGTLRLGALVAADPVLARDGTSRALGAAGELAPDRALAQALASAAGATGPVVSADLPDGASEAAPGAIARDLQSAAVLAAAARGGAAAAVVLLVVHDRMGARMDVDAVHEAELALGGAGAAALGAA